MRNKKTTIGVIIAIVLCLAFGGWALNLLYTQKKEEIKLAELSENKTETAQLSEREAESRDQQTSSELTQKQAGAETPEETEAAEEPETTEGTPVTARRTAANGTEKEVPEEITEETTEKTTEKDTEEGTEETTEKNAEESSAGTSKETTAQAGHPTAVTVTPTPAADIPVDFDSLQKENSDIYAWITVPGTDVDYPIVQYEGDNSYYLTHDYDGQPSSHGAVYTESWNTKDFQDPMTVIYGHNMRDGSMFASLHKFEDREFFDEHREFIIYTPERIFHYTIFAAYTYTNKHILNNYDFSKEKVFQKYLDEIYGLRSMNNYFLDDPIVTTSDKIVTLSTCIGNHAYRYLVQGVLTEVE